MQTTLRGTDAELTLIDQLLQQPQRFEFFQAVRLLIGWLAEHGVAPEQALADYVRFDNSVSMDFPASQIEALQADSSSEPAIRSEAALLQALLARQLRHIHITPAFMGFLGSQGVLPSHYSERIASYQHNQRDDSARAFLDMFSNRVLALFYAAWNKYRVEHWLHQGSDTFLPLLLALAGDNDPIAAQYAGLLQQRPVSAAVMARMLSDHFQVAIGVEEAVGHMNPMAANEQTALGGSHAILGARATIGPRSWRPDLRVRIHIGPLDRSAFAHFLPGAPGAAALKNMLQLFGNPLVTHEVRLILRQADVVGITLGAQPQSSLGWNSFLTTAPAQADRPDMRYELQLMAPFAG